ncbi:MAG: hypothetical protein LBD81_02900 [Holosporaceae bacterium]|jgi:hypothetical protein|nr:hypothetical protein [Holosporaceae bacterium]
MKDVWSAPRITETTSVAEFVNVAALPAASDRNLWRKQQTVKLPYVENVVFYGVKNVEKYADRLSSYGRD